MKQAKSVSEISQVLSPKPLVDREEFDEFYSPRFENVESDSTKKLIVELKKRHGADFYRVFLSGHSGTGKSTELTRLSRELEAHFEFIRLSAQEDLSPFSTQPFDVLEVMAVNLCERANNLNLALDRSLLERIEAWFTEITERSASAATGEGSARIGAEAGTPGLLGRILKLGAGVKAEARFSSSRLEERVRRRLQRISELKDLCNDLFRECKRCLREKNGKEWVFLLEDFEKGNVDDEVVRRVFVTYSNAWTGLQTHLICTVPLWLTSGEAKSGLPFGERRLVDIPVYGKDHQPWTPGRDLVRGILERRLDPALFDQGVLESLIVAGGGNLRDTFALIVEAAVLAEVKELSRIERAQADRAVNWLRNEYLQRLGETSPDAAVDYLQKVQLLKEIYEARGRRMVQDPLLYRLLRSRVVLEHNDVYWYGLPPMVVDILVQQGHLAEGSSGGLELHGK